MRNRILICAALLTLISSVGFGDQKRYRQMTVESSKTCEAMATTLNSDEQIDIGEYTYDYLYVAYSDLCCDPRNGDGTIKVLHDFNYPCDKYPEQGEGK